MGICTECNEKETRINRKVCEACKKRAYRARKLDASSASNTSGLDALDASKLRERIEALERTIGALGGCFVEVDSSPIYVSASICKAFPDKSGLELVQAALNEVANILAEDK